MGSLRALQRHFFRHPSDQVARDLLGRYLIRELGGRRLVLRLVETEAYLGPDDRAAHTWGGRRTERVRSMYLGGGRAYVYAIYGLHCCLNVVCGVIKRMTEPNNSEEMTPLRLPISTANPMKSNIVSLLYR